MRNIVFPTDFSENALNALKYAVELFKYEKCEFFLLHAYADEVYNEETQLNQKQINDLKKVVLSHAETNLQEVLEAVREYAPNPRHSFKTIASFGPLVEEVNEVVNAKNADLCIMGTRGKTNTKKNSFGSNTLAVMKYVQCPVLSIPENYSFSSPENILFPTNYLIPYQKRELKLVSEIARVFGSEIHFLYISKFPVESFRQRENQTFIKEQCFNLKFQCHQVEEQDKLQAIMNFIEKNNTDLLVMVNSRQTYLEHFLLEGTIEKIGLYPKIPFLVLQNFNRETQ